ncbi:YARHG domain-containing protein [Mediterraneibacter glycyrrhizinilyticus]|nr:YARHG domain-containing protein [Mediterraneibacter glycyrrhizinilyticus]MBM6853639.1 YARHG domain-containing protein [Mediterraneibacter glycyrrhizinilyticus]
MAFGKKKQEKEQKVKVQTVAMSQNPLYQQQESSLRESLTAIGIAAVAVLLFLVIVSKFSYYSTGYNRGYNYAGTAVSPDVSSLAADDAGNDPEAAYGEEMYDGATESTAESSQGGDIYNIEGTEALPYSSAAEASEEDPPMHSSEDGSVSEAYILVGSDIRYISESELTGLTEDQLRYARNEIYARHGRRFDDAGLQSYFDSKDWYNGTISPEDFEEASLSEVEKANLETIVAYESAQGYR